MNDEKIERLAKEIRIRPGAFDDGRIIKDATNALERTVSARALAARLSLWRTIMRSPITKLAAAAVIIAAIAITATLWNKKIPTMIPTAYASAVEVLNDAAKAVENVRSIHIKARMRTLPKDNMGMIGLEYDFVPIEMWKKVDEAGNVLWKVEKPGRELPGRELPRRVLVVNAESTIMLIWPNTGVKREPVPIGSFDTWYAHLMDVDKIIDNALKGTMSQSGSQMCMRNEVVKEGAELILEIESAAQGDFTNDWCKNKFITESDHKMVYRFDAETKLLKGFEVFVHTDKEDVLVFEVIDIEYNPQLDDDLFTVELPKDMIWHEEVKVLPDNEKYEQMTPKQAAETFFKACSEKNWDEALKFWTASRIDDRIKENIGGIEIISIGEPFKSGLYPGWFVPYEIKLPQTARMFCIRLSNANPAKRLVITGLCDTKLNVARDWKWSKEPEILPDNEVYATMSPENVVNVFNDAFSKEDWDKMRKIAPEDVAEGFKHDIEIWKKQSEFKQGQPFCEIVDKSFWSAEKSAYFVKCRQYNVGNIKKMNLAIRNDNPAQRWVVDGGF